MMDARGQKHEALPSEAEVTARLRELSRRADLRAARRLEVKVDMSAAAVTRRLRRQSSLRELCRRLGAAGASTRS